MKITFNRLFDMTTILMTEAGKAIQPFADYCNGGFEQVIRALRNGLTFQDNFNCQLLNAEMTHNTYGTIYTQGKRPSRVTVSSVDSTTTGVDVFHWYINLDGLVQARVKFDPVPTSPLKVNFLIEF